MVSANSVVIAALFLTISGCAKSPPKCSDDETFTLVRKIIVDQIGGSEGITENELRENLKFEYARASAFDENIKKLSCEAKLVAGDQYQLPITYESQLDDNNDHIVFVSGIAMADLLAVKSGLSEGIKKSRAANSTPEERPSSESPKTDITGIWKGPLEGEGEMEIKKSSTGYEVSLSVNTEGCAGSIDGPATLSGNELKLTKTEDDQTCTITAKLNGGSAELSEDGCSYYHGMACSFSGTLNKVK